MRRMIAVRFSILLFILLFPALLFAADPDRDPFYTQGHYLTSAPSSDSVYEYVDPFSGFLTLVQTDLVLPGNGGLDVRIMRTYNSAIWGRRDPTSGSTSLVAYVDWSPVGIGWSMHMGIVRNPFGTLTNPVVEMPDGSQHILYTDKNNTSQNITRDYWTYKSVGSGVWELTLSDGTVYTFKYSPGVAGYSDNNGVEVAQVTSIQNASRTSTISISYYLYGSYSFMRTITDTVGRSINFNYDYAGHRLNTITVTANPVDSRTFAYNYQTINTGVPHGDQNFLIKMTPPVGDPWIYDYNTAPLTFDIQKITYPTGGTISYTYGEQYFDTGMVPVKFRVVTQRTTGGRDIPAGTWTYSYSTGGANGNTTTITGPGGLSETYTFNAWGNKCPNSGLCDNIWEIGLPISKEVKINASTILSEAYSWTKGTQISNDNVANADWNGYGGYIYDTEADIPFLSAKSVTRDGSTYTTTYSNRDTYGNPGTISESGDKTRTSTISYWTNSTKNIVKDKPSSVAVSGSFTGSFTTTYTYDNNSGNVTQVSKYGVTADYTYYSNGNLNTSKDANNKTTTYAWSNGRISTITPPESGTTITRVINSNGTIKSETNGRGYTTNFTYDGNLRLTSITPPVGNPTSFTYPTDNSYKKETRGSFYTYYYYDGFGRQEGTSDLVGVTTDIYYKSYGPKDYSTSNVGDTIYYDYFGRKTSVTHKDSSSIVYSYSGSDETVTDEASKITRFYYDAFGNPDEKYLGSIVDAKINTTSFTYNMAGSVLSSAQGAISRTFGYSSPKNFLTSMTDSETGATTYGRDNVGNMTSKTDSLGTTSYTYDNINRLKTISYGSTITITYDGASNRTSMDAPSATIDYSYDEANRLTRKTETIGTQTYYTDYRYDSNDNLTDIYYPPSGYPSGRHIVYGYNTKNQVISVTGFGGSITPVNYCSAAPCLGLPSSFTDANGLTTSLTYNNRNLTTRTTTGASVDTGYGYDTRGNMTSLTDYVTSSNNQTLDYDELSRIKTFNATQLWGNGSFTYDAAGNRLSKTAGGTSSYNYSSNRLSSTSGGGESIRFPTTATATLPRLADIHLPMTGFTTLQAIRTVHK
ncbi:MAG: hypothetical protein M0Z71_00140 [Nitrospiraceae bacterium]|nr:hypothetical protein [Nitrospiraceae bacterium]